MRVTHKQLVDLALPVLDTACEGWQYRVQRAIERGVGLEFDQWDIDSAARWSSVYGHIECLKALIAVGVSQWGIDDSACAASANGHVECLRLLLAEGVSQDNIDEAARRAVQCGHIECQKLLEEAKAKEE